MKKLWPKIRYALIYCFIWMLVNACYVDDGSDSYQPKQDEKMTWEKLEEYEEQKENEEKELELEDERWELSQMHDEEFLCYDEFYHVSDSPEMFCRCLVEKVALRWSYDDYKRHSYTYLMRLNNNGVLERCLEKPNFWHQETDEEIKSDKEFDPESEEAKKMLDDSFTENENDD